MDLRAEFNHFYLVSNNSELRFAVTWPEKKRKKNVYKYKVR